MSRTGLTPISEISENPTNAVRWFAEFPDYMPSDRVGVNTGLLAKMARLGGLSDVTVLAHAGDTTEVLPESGKLNEDGTLTGAASATQEKVPLGQGSAREPGLESSVRGYYDFYWSPATLRLNTSEMTDTLSRQPGGKLRDPRAWSALINKSLGEGLRDAARQALVTNIPLADRLSEASSVPIWAAFDTYFSLDLAQSALMLPVQVVSYQLAQVILAQQRGISIKEKRWSIFPSTQLDRVVALNALTRSAKITREIRR